jgi:two-component system, cell cycle response regulator CpdR
MKKLLIVDDDNNLLNYLNEELTEAGYKVKTYDNGADAIVAAAEETFDLILLDMLMPGLDGIQVVRVLQKVAPKVPIIGLTGYVGRGYMTQAMGLGVSILTKPVEIPTLVKEINDTIELNLRK